MNEQDLKASIEQTMAEITEMLQKSMPLAKDDEEGGVDDAEVNNEPAPEIEPAPESDAGGEVSEGADEHAAEEAVEDLGAMDGEGEDGMDGRAEVEQMVADMSDDELMLMLEVMQAESAARGHGEEGVEADEGEEASSPEEVVEYSPEESEEMGKSEHEKGVHAPFNGDGQSLAGSHVRDGNYAANQGWKGGKEHGDNKAKEHHKKVLGEMKAMKKPDLGKSTGQEKGVHQPNMENSGSSRAGRQVERGLNTKAVAGHKKVLNEMKAMKKPDLGKSEEKDEEKDEMKKSIQYLSETVDMLLAQVATPKAPAPVTKPLAVNRPVGQALEKSMPAPKAPERLAKSDAIKALIDIQRKEQNVPMAKKTVTSEMVGDLHRAQGEVADKMITALVESGLIGK